MSHIIISTRISDLIPSLRFSLPSTHKDYHLYLIKIEGIKLWHSILLIVHILVFWIFYTYVNSWVVLYQGWDQFIFIVTPKHLKVDWDDARLCALLPSHVWLFCDHGLYPTSLLHPWDFPGESTIVDCHLLLQGIFLTQWLYPGILHWQEGSLPLSHQGSPGME